MIENDKKHQERYDHAVGILETLSKKKRKKIERELPHIFQENPNKIEVKVSSNTINILHEPKKIESYFFSFEKKILLLLESLENGVSILFQNAKYFCFGMFVTFFLIKIYL
jgi:5-methylcytosine-specific restriction endonuclease McrBC GTP-binding regulatory subunit McrB